MICLHGWKTRSLVSHFLGCLLGCPAGTGCNWVITPIYVGWLHPLSRLYSNLPANYLRSRTQPDIPVGIIFFSLPRVGVESNIGEIHLAHVARWAGPLLSRSLVIHGVTWFTHKNGRKYMGFTGVISTRNKWSSERPPTEITGFPWPTLWDLCFSRNSQILQVFCDSKPVVSTDLWNGLDPKGPFVFYAG